MKKGALLSSFFCVFLPECYPGHGLFLHKASVFQKRTHVWASLFG